MMPKFNLKDMINVIYKYKCDELWLVPRKLLSQNKENKLVQQSFAYTQFYIQLY